MKASRIGLLGAGNMGEALIRGLLTSGTLNAEQIRASDVDREALSELGRRYGLVTHASNRELVGWAELLVLAVKPQVMDRALDDVAVALQADAVVVSIAAGVPLSVLARKLPEKARVIRAMPNTAAIALCSATAIAPGEHATQDDLEDARALFEAIGRVVVLDEGALDAVTGLSGSGPAYVMLFIEALADGGVRMGLPRDVALLLAAQTVYGSAKLLLESGEHPARLRDKVTSPGGTTIEGLDALEAGRMRHTLIDAVKRATRRATELGVELARKLDARG
jgi:pyrroline-5-carboxylate reductase